MRNIKSKKTSTHVRQGKTNEQKTETSKQHQNKLGEHTINNYPPKQKHQAT